LCLPNVYTGYAYLLDEKNRVRWHGCGEGTEEEVQGLLKCAQVLVNEQQGSTVTATSVTGGSQPRGKGGKYHNKH